MIFLFFRRVFATWFPRAFFQDFWWFWGSLGAPFPPPGGPFPPPGTFFASLLEEISGLRSSRVSGRPPGCILQLFLMVLGAILDAFWSYFDGFWSYLWRIFWSTPEEDLGRSWEMLYYFPACFPMLFGCLQLLYWVLPKYFEAVLIDSRFISKRGVSFEAGFTFWEIRSQAPSPLKMVDLGALLGLSWCSSALSWRSWGLSQCSFGRFYSLVVSV